LDGDQKELDQRESELEQVRERREKRSEKQDKLKDQIQQKQSKRDSLKAEKELLNDIARSNEAFPSSVNYLLENHSDDFACIGPVSKLFSTDEEHAVALESVLGQALNYLVVESMGDAQTAGELL